MSRCFDSKDILTYDRIMSKLTTTSLGLTDAILDLDYGDEQERFRYYEAYAVIVHLQLILIPIAGAVAVFAFGSSAIAPVLAMLFAVFSCVLLGKLHLERHQVPMELIALSARNRTYLGVYLVAWLVLLIAIATTGLSGTSFGPSPVVEPASQRAHIEKNSGGDSPALRRRPGARP